MNRRLVIKNPTFDTEVIHQYLIENEIPYKFQSSPNPFSSLTITLDEKSAMTVRSVFGTERLEYEEVVNM